MPPVPAISFESGRDPFRELAWVRTLESFGVPFLCYDADATCVYTSRVAVALSGCASTHALMRAQASHAIAEQRYSNAPIPIGDFALLREVPMPAQQAILAVHVARSPSASCAAVLVIRPPSADQSAYESLGNLTPREIEVARLVAGGLSTKAIAHQLGISMHTTRHHTEHVFAKLGVRNRAGVAALLASRLNS